MTKLHGPVLLISVVGSAIWYRKTYLPLETDKHMKVVFFMFSRHGKNLVFVILKLYRGMIFKYHIYRWKSCLRREVSLLDFKLYDILLLDHFSPILVPLSILVWSFIECFHPLVRLSARSFIPLGGVNLIWLFCLLLLATFDWRLYMLSSLLATPFQILHAKSYPLNSNAHILHHCYVTELMNLYNDIAILQRYTWLTWF